MSVPSEYDGDCSRLQGKISAYVDGELPAQEALEVERHLHTCVDCRTEEQAFRALWSALEDPLPIHAPASIAEAVLQRIDEDVTDDESTISFPLRHLWPASAVVAAVCLMLGGFLAQTLMDKEADNSGNNTITRSLDIFSPAPEGTLANGYFAMIQNSGSRP